MGGGAVCLHRRPIRANGRSPARQAINVTVTYCMGSAPLQRPRPPGRAPRKRRGPTLGTAKSCSGRRPRSRILRRLFADPVLTVTWLRKSEENLMARMFSRITLN